VAALVKAAMWSHVEIRKVTGCWHRWKRFFRGSSRGAIAALAFSGAVLLGGCATIGGRMPTATDVPTETRRDGPVVGVAQVRDDRKSTVAGKVGNATINTSVDVDVYLEDSVKRGLAQKGLAAVDAPEPSVSATSVFKGKIVLVTLQSLSIGTADAILFPANTTAAIAIQVYDANGKVIYGQAFSGTASGRIGLHSESGYEEAIGALMSSAMDQAVTSAMADTKLSQAVR